MELHALEELYRAIETRDTKEVMVDRGGIVTFIGRIISASQDSFVISDDKGVAHKIQSREVISLS